MHPQYQSRFELKPGTWVFVPTDESRDFGSALIKRVLKRWTPPKYLYNLKEGGHVAAARLHCASANIVRLDIDRFFDRVTRTKVARALRAIGFDAADSFDAARASTVIKPGSIGFSIPFGFVQSPLLASLVLDRSALGRQLRQIRKSGANVSVYVDDILVSAEANSTVKNASDGLRNAATASNLPLNEAKSQLQPKGAAEAFNLHIGGGELRVNGERMTRFRADAFDATFEQLEGYARYLHSVNEDQAIAYIDELKEAGLEIEKA
jgi:hypothetical protein